MSLVLLRGNPVLRRNASERYLAQPVGRASAAIPSLETPLANGVSNLHCGAAGLACFRMAPFAAGCFSGKGFGNVGLVLRSRLQAVGQAKSGNRLRK